MLAYKEVVILKPFFMFTYHYLYKKIIIMIKNDILYILLFLKDFNLLLEIFYIPYRY